MVILGQGVLTLLDVCPCSFSVLKGSYSNQDKLEYGTVNEGDTSSYITCAIKSYKLQEPL